MIMKLIRENVFETNSSSANSFSLNKGKKAPHIYDTLYPDEDGTVRIDCGIYNFNRQMPKRTNDTKEKIAFFATLAKDHRYYEYLLPMLRNIIVKNSEAYNVEFLNLGESEIEFWSDFDIPEKETTLYKAVFDKNSWLFLQGDEYLIYDDDDKFYRPEPILE